MHIAWTAWSVKFALFNESLEFIHSEASSAFAVPVLTLGHCFLNDSCDFLGGLREHLVHILGHWVAFSEVLCCALSCLCVRVQRCLILFEEFLFDSNVMVSDAEDDQAVFRLAWLLIWLGSSFSGGHVVVRLLLSTCVGRWVLGNELILDENESLHRVLESELVLAHL
jgi:hypothetical protein